MLCTTPTQEYFSNYKMFFFKPYKSCSPSPEIDTPAWCSPDLFLLLCPLGEVLLSTTTSGKGGETVSLTFPNLNCSETFLPSTQSQGTSSRFRHLDWDQAPISNIIEGGVLGGCVFSQPIDEEGQERLSKGRQGFQQHASMENLGSLSSEHPSPGNNHSDAIQLIPFRTIWAFMAAFPHTIAERAESWAWRDLRIILSQAEAIKRQASDLLLDMCGVMDTLILSLRPRCFRMIWSDSKNGHISPPTQGHKSLHLRCFLCGIDSSENEGRWFRYGII